MSESDELSRLLSAWAARHRLTEAQAVSVRAHVLATAPATDTAAPVLDGDWLWSLLRPVTALVERLDREPSVARAASWPATTGGQWTIYLQLA